MEAGDELRVPRQFGRQHFDGHGALQGNLTPFVKRPHAPRPMSGLNLILRQQHRDVVRRRRLPILRDLRNAHRDRGGIKRAVEQTGQVVAVEGIGRNRERPAA